MKIGSLTITRDSALWWAGMIGGAVTALAAHLDLFPWIPVQAQHAIELAAFLAAVFSGKMATSPLPGAGGDAPRGRVDVSKIAPVILLAVALGAGALTGCAKVSPALSPTGVAAVNATEVVHALDTVRDVAKVVSDAYPAVVTPADFQAILTWHTSIVTVIGQVPNGWKATALSAFDQMQGHLSAAAQARLAPYLVLARSLVDAFVPAAGPDPSLQRAVAASLAVDVSL